MFKKILLFTLAVLCPAGVFAYDNKTTHLGLTSQIIELYESTGKQLSTEQKQAIIDGSKLEDITPRYINHFYDPINDTAWTGSKTGNISAETTRLLSKLGLSSEDPLKATEWINNHNIQLSYGPYEGDRTWDRALNYYAKGNTLEAYKTLGFILHVLEDMSVPEHTRDDTHAQSLESITSDSGSPYEEFTSQYNQNNISSLGLISEIKELGLSIPQKSNPEEYLKSLAIYSNKYFFSKDTINDPRYSEPKIIEEKNEFGYGKDEGGKLFELVAIDILYSQNKNKSKDYKILNKPEYKPILSAYFNRLAKQTIVHGVGLMQLFDRQAEDALVNKDFPQHLVVLDHDKLDTVLNLPTFSFAGLVSKFYGMATTALGAAVEAGRSVQEGAYHAGQTIGDFLSNLLKNGGYDTALTNNLTPPSEQSDEGDENYGFSNRIGDPSDSNPENLFVLYDGDQLELIETNHSPIELLTTTTASSTTTLAVITTEDLQPMPAPERPIRIVSGSGSGSGSTAPPTTPDPAPTAPSEHILISEILFNASSTDKGKEFVELYNPLPTEQNLGGWSLKYIKENSTTTTSLASFKASSTEDKVVIPAKGFLLVGFYSYTSSSYDGRDADITRSAQLPNGGTSATPQRITINLYNSDKGIVDSLFYDKNSVSSEGQSLEREVKLADGTCTAALNEYEFSGHGCDISGVTNFVSREIPKPQNSSSLPEPREKPEMPGLAVGRANIAEVDKSALKIKFEWSESKDYSQSTSTVKYVLTSGTSTVSEVYSTGTEISVFEIGKNYNHKLFAEDLDGLRSNEVVTSVFFPDFPDNVYFYKDPREVSPTSTKYFVDLRYSSRPFITAGDSSWQAIVGYLDREPNSANSMLTTGNDFKVSDGNGVLFTYIFATDPTRCNGVGGGLNNSAGCLPEEDGRLAFNLDILASTTAQSSHVKLAYYSFTHSGGGSQELSHIASGPKIYLLDGLPTQQNPTTPANFALSFDDMDSELSLSWEKSTDPDSADSEITYEIKISSSTDESSSSTWTNLGKTLTHIVAVEPPNNYSFELRAKDDFENYSEAAPQNFTFPAGYEKPFLSARIDSGASQPFTVPTDGILGEISVYTADFVTASRNPEMNPCALTLYEQAAGINTQIAIPDNSFNGNTCTGEKIFTFNSSTTQLYASSTYAWSFNYSGVPNDPPKLRFYGKSTPLPAGPFSNGSLGSAKFKIKDNEGNVLIEN